MKDTLHVYQNNFSTPKSNCVYFYITYLTYICICFADAIAYEHNGHNGESYTVKSPGYEVGKGYTMVGVANTYTFTNVDDGYVMLSFIKYDINKRSTIRVSNGTY